MKIGLLGFGVVGKGVYELARMRQDMQVAKVVCLEDITLPDAQVTRDFQDVLNDPSIDTVVEAMGGLHPAFEFVKAAMEAGKNIVTSNKALVATFYDVLVPLAQEKKLSFRCTAAVGGGIGWLSELERSRRSQTIQEVGGIMNGTCNYILDAMHRMGLSYDEALKQAQGLGYAEAKPATDVEGIDTWHKILLSANVAFGVTMDKDSVPVSGISQIGPQDVAAFQAHGLVCKLVSRARRTQSGISAYVQPTLYPQGSLEAAVPSNYNLITFIGSASEQMSFYGQGAGRYPTAYNVLQDCIDVLSGKPFYVPYGPVVEATNQEPLRFYVRGETDEFLESHTQEHWGEGVVTAPVAVSRMHQWHKDHPQAFLGALSQE